MKLYFFNSGTLTCDKSLLTMGKDVGKTVTVPVPFFLIDHPKGKVLYDTGNALEVAKDARKHWGAVCDVYVPDVSEDDYIVNQLEKIGVKPEEISLVVMSHLHLDHAGGVGAFPNAKYFVQKDELQWAYAPQFYQKPAYIRPDFDKDVQWFILNGYLDDGFDLFDDGSLRIWFTPGHTPGHQSLVVKLEKDGTFVLTGDCCYVEEILNEDILPGLVWSPPYAVESIQRLRHARNIYGYKIVTGHDPWDWETYKKAPEYYE